MKSRLLIIIFLIQLSASSFAQNNPFLDNFQYTSVKNILISHNSNIIYTLYQDKQGMMWFGTKSGLYSYDGLKTQDHISDYEIQGHSIYSIVEMNPYIMAIGSENGFMIYNQKTDSYEEIPETLNQLKDIRCMLLKDSIFYIGSGNMGMCMYDIKDNKLNRIPIDGRLDDSRTYSLEIQGNNIYIGSYSGLSVFNIKTGKRTSIPLPSNLNIVHALCFDNTKQNLWIATETDLIKYNISTNEMTIVENMDSNSYKALSCDDKGNMIVGTDNGLYIYNISSHTCRHITHNVEKGYTLNKIIWSTFIDRNNNIWIGTERGVNFMSREPSFRFVYVSDLSSISEGNNFSCSITDKKGTYWFGGNNGLLHYNMNTNSWDWFGSMNKDSYISNNQIHSIYEDKDGIIWIATDNGIHWYNEKTNKFVAVQIENKERNRNANWTYDILEDELGRLWITTYSGGLFIIDKKIVLKNNKSTFIADYNLTSPGFNIYEMKKDSKGFFWANAQNGLTRINPNTLETKTYNIWMDCMTIDDNDCLWYSTMGRIFELNLNTMKKNKINYQLYHNTITCMTTENNHLWFASSDGAFTMDYNDRKVYNLPVPSHFYTSVVYDKSNKKLLWGGEDGILVLSPQKTYTQSLSTGPITITSLKSNGKELLPNKDYNGDCIRYMDNVSIPYKYHNITFEFSDFDYSEDYKRPIFRLKEGDNQWEQLEMGDNSISFANLAPGSYTLQLKYLSYKGNVENPIKEFQFTILPPWYQSNWAYILYFVIFILLVCILARLFWQLSKKKLNEREREKTFELTKMKMDFFTNISHELKTPLTLIIGPLGSLISKTSNSEQKKELEDIQKNAFKLNTLIHKILDIRQIQGNDEDVLYRSHIEINTLIKNVISLFTSIFEKNNITTSFNSDCDSIWMNLDRLKLESVIINIISNSLKYIPQNNGHITVSLHKDSNNNNVQITIKDNGKGIDKAELPYVFIRFFRGKENESMNNNGHGIGLYLVKKYSEFHGGSVMIDSEIGKGTSITVSLPFIGDNIIIDENSQAENEIDKDEDNRSTILIIDDNEEILSFLSRTFSLKHRCIIARDGSEGLDKIKHDKVDFVIVDEMMPVMSGLQFCKEFRKMIGYAKVPVVMLTAKDDRKTELQSIEAGVDAFISKPFDIDKLSMRIEQMIHSRNMIEESVRIKDYTEKLPEIKLKDNDSNESFLIKLTDVIEKNIENPEFNVTMLNEALGMDAKSLYRKLKNITGMTPVNYIRKIRLKKAAALLKQKRFSASEVMYMVGYSNASYFTKCFTEEFGVSPKKYSQKS